MKNLRKWMLGILCLMIIGILITGCGGGGSSSPSSPAVSSSPSPTAILSENFNTATADTFFTTTYKALTSDASIPMYRAKSGSPVIGDGTLSIGNARLIIGAKADTDTTATTTPGGDFDLSKAWKISFKVVAINGTDTNKKFQICVDNNTTGSANSPLGADSRIHSIAANTLTAGQTYTVTSDLGTTTSFIMIRVENGAIVTIDDLIIEYQ